jgi:hypothetical protein
MTPRQHLERVQAGLAKGDNLSEDEARLTLDSLRQFNEARHQSRDYTVAFGVTQAEWERIWEERPRLRQLDAKARARAEMANEHHTWLARAGHARVILKTVGLTLEAIGLQEEYDRRSRQHALL